jgi:hypothetical protein
VKGDSWGLMGENKAMSQYSVIRSNIEKALDEEPGNLSSQRLLELTKQIDQMIIDQIKQAK